jgi:putative endonuclease
MRPDGPELARHGGLVEGRVFLSRASEVSRGTVLPDFPRGWYCYLLLCIDGTYSCGLTKNLGQRLRDHASGKGSGYTKGTKPVALVWYERHDNRGTAAQRERPLKKWSHSKKKDLVEGRLRFASSGTNVWVSLV